MCYKIFFETIILNISDEEKNEIMQTMMKKIC
jgi:hypothetical protein